MKLVKRTAAVSIMPATMFAQRFAVGFRIRDSRIIAIGISMSIAIPTYAPGEKWITPILPFFDPKTSMQKNTSA
jgi:hypothetical protein